MKRRVRRGAGRSGDGGGARSPQRPLRGGRSYRDEGHTGEAAIETREAARATSGFSSNAIETAVEERPERPGGSVTTIETGILGGGVKTDQSGQVALEQPQGKEPWRGGDQRDNAAGLELPTTVLTKGRAPSFTATFILLYLQLSY